MKMQIIPFNIRQPFIHYLFLAFLFLLPLLVLGQQEKRAITTAVPFLNIKTDARSTGMGSLGVASSPDIYAQFWNTAKYTFAEGENAIAVSYLPYARRVSNNLFMAGLSYYEQRNERSAWGTSLKYFSLGEIELNQFQGGQIVELGVERPNEFAVDFSYNLKLNNDFSMGVTSRFFRSDIGFWNGTSKATLNSLAFDISAYYEKDFGDNIRFRSGAEISNIGSKVKYDSDQTPNFIPTQLRFGSGATFTFENQQSLLVLLEFSKLLVPSLIDTNNEINFLNGIFRSFSEAPGGFSEELKEINWGLGAEYSLNDIFKFRTGYYRENPQKGSLQYLYLGLGVNRYNIQFDLAYLINTADLQSQLQNSLSFSAGIPIQFKSKEEAAIEAIENETTSVENP